MTRCRELGQLNWENIAKTVTGAATVVQNVASSGEDLLTNPLAAAIKSVSFRTRYSPEKTYTGKQLQAMYRDDTPNPYLKFLQPTIVLDTAFGRQVMAPYGEAPPNEWEKNLRELAITGGAITLTLAGGFMLLGAWLTKPRSRP